MSIFHGKMAPNYEEVGRVGSLDAGFQQVRLQVFKSSKNFPILFWNINNST